MILLLRGTQQLNEPFDTMILHSIDFKLIHYRVHSKSASALKGGGRGVLEKYKRHTKMCKGEGAPQRMYVRL